VKYFPPCSLFPVPCSLFPVPCYFDFAKRRYNHLKTRDPWFPGNTAEKLSEFDLEPYIKNSPHRDKIVGILEDAHQLLNI